MYFRVISIALAIVTCVAMSMMPSKASPVPDFTCDVKPHPLLNADGYLLGQGIYLMGDESVGLVGYAEPSQQLPRIVSGSGMQFSNEKITFWAKGDEGFLEMDDGTLFPCKAASSASGQSNLNEPAIALGTIVRQQPDASANRIERLPDNEPVRLVAEAGNYFNDYQWFEIEYGEGRRGYAWGGTLCVDSELAGVLIDCRVHAGRPAAANGSGGVQVSPETAIVRGRSLFGSIIRRETDGGSAKVGSIPQGEPLEIVMQTGVFLDGWQWIRVRNGGLEGYAWGGTVCITDGTAITGVHDRCD